MTSGRPVIRATVSGSFRRHLTAVQDAVTELRDYGAVVLSPSDPRAAGSFGDFLFVRSDARRSIKGVQNRHLEAIARSDFLWLVCPDGYVGQSAAMEVGFAVAASIPIYSDGVPADWTLRQYVVPTGNLAAALRSQIGQKTKEPIASPSLILEPEIALASAHAYVSEMEHVLLRDRTQLEPDPIEKLVGEVRSLISLPTNR